MLKSVIDSVIIRAVLAANALYNVRIVLVTVASMTPITFCLAALCFA